MKTNFKIKSQNQRTEYLSHRKNAKSECLDRIVNHQQMGKIQAFERPQNQDKNGKRFIDFSKGDLETQLIQSRLIPTRQPRAAELLQDYPEHIQISVMKILSAKELGLFRIHKTAKPTSTRVSNHEIYESLKTHISNHTKSRSQLNSYRSSSQLTLSKQHQTPDLPTKYHSSNVSMANETTLAKIPIMNNYVSQSPTTEFVSPQQSQLHIPLVQHQIFSEKVMSRIMRIQTALAMGYFKSQKDSPTGKVLGKMALPTYGKLQPRRQSVMNYVQARKRGGLLSPTMIQNLQRQLQEETSPKKLLNNVQQIIMPELNFMNTLHVAKKFIHGTSLLNQPQNNINSHHSPNSHKSNMHLYYPSICLQTIYRNQIYYWKVKFKDMTDDRQFYVLFVHGESKGNHFFRIDLPITQSTQGGITIWPTVLENLKDHCDNRCYTEEISKYLSLRLENKHIHTNFLSGLTHRAKGKITRQDLEACQSIQLFFYKFINNQVTTVRKIIGNSFEILPSVKKNDYEYYINFGRLNNIINLIKNSLRMQKILLMQTMQQIRYRVRALRILKLQYEDMITNQVEILNSIFAFRFVAESKGFLTDGINDLCNIMNHKILIHSTLIKPFKNQTSFVVRRFLDFNLSHCLLNLHIINTKDLLHDFSNLLWDYQNQNNDNGQAIHQIDLVKPCVSGKVKLRFNHEYVHFSVSPYFYQKEQKGNKEATNFDVIQPFMINKKTYKALLRFAKENPKFSDTAFINTFKRLSYNRFLFSVLLHQEESEQQKEIFQYLLSSLFAIDLVEAKVILKPDYLYLSQSDNHQGFLPTQIVEQKVKSKMLFSVSPYELIFNKKQQMEYNTESSKKESLIRNLNLDKLKVQDIHIGYLQQNQKQVQIEDLNNEFNNSNKEQIDHTSPPKKEIQSIFKRMVRKAQVGINFNRTNKKIIITFHKKFLINVVYDFPLVKVITKDKSFVFRQEQSKENQSRNTVKRISLMQKHLQQTACIEFIAQLQKSRLLQNFNGVHINKFQSVESRKIQIPPLIRLKILLINHDHQLKKIFSNIHFTLFYRNPNIRSYIIQAHIYYQQQTRLEGGYCYDGEQLYFLLDIFDQHSKTKSFKMIFTNYDLQDIFSIYIGRTFTDQDITKAIYKIIRLTYAEKNILSMQTRYVSPYLKRQSKSSSMMSGITPRTKKFGQPQLITPEQLSQLDRVTNGRFIIQHEESKDTFNKYFCDVQTKDTRTIGHYPIRIYMSSTGKVHLHKPSNFVSFEYAILTTQAHLLIDCFILVIYVPRTSRQLVCWINVLELSEIDIIQDLLKLTDLKVKNYIQLKNYATIQTTNLTRQQSQSVVQSQTREQRFLTSRKQQQSLRILKPISDNLIKKQKEDKFKLIQKFFLFTRQLSSDLSLRERYRFMFQKTLDSSILVEHFIWEQIIKYLRVTAKDFINIRFDSDTLSNKYFEKSLTGQLEEDYMQSVDNHDFIHVIGQKFVPKGKHTQQETMLMKINKQHVNQVRNFLHVQNATLIKLTNKPSQFQFSFGKLLVPLKDFIHKSILRFDKIGVTSIYFQIESDDEGLSKRQSMKMMNGSLENPFQVFEPIYYGHTSSYNLELHLFCYHFNQPLVYKQASVNIREILNLYIADGFFRYQTNYMNAKLSLSDLRSICEYIASKIKTQNYLGLAGKQRPLREFKAMQIFVEEQKDQEQQTDGHVYTKVCKGGYLKQIQLFLKRQKIHVNTQLNGLEVFKQRKIYFDECEEILPVFTIMVKNGLYVDAMRRIIELV